MQNAAVMESIVALKDTSVILKEVIQMSYIQMSGVLSIPHSTSIASPCTSFFLPVFCLKSLSSVMQRSQAIFVSFYLLPL